MIKDRDVFINTVLVWMGPEPWQEVVEGLEEGACYSAVRRDSFNLLM